MVLRLASALLLFAVSVATTECDFAERNRQTIEQLYDLVVYPNNLPIIQGLQAPEGLFDANVRGRITPVGAFDNLETSLEYFFALAVATPPNYFAFSEANVVEFSSGCPEVAASTVYLKSSSFDPSGSAPKQGPTLKQIAFWRFNEDGAVQHFDAWVPNLSRWVEESTGADPYSPEARQATIAGICFQTMQTCTGLNQQFDSVEHCIGVLSLKPFGHFDDAWGDNVVCRSIHLILTASRPDVHCPHVGPTGGGKCVNLSYQEKYFDDTKYLGKPAHELFKCPEGKKSEKGGKKEKKRH